MILDHKHLLIKTYVNNPPDTAGVIKKWMVNLIEEIDMKLLSGPHIEYVDKEGNMGFTAVAIIETSHIAMHIWDEDNPALIQLDVYSCADFDPKFILFLLEDFHPIKTDWKFIDRNLDLREISWGALTPDWSEVK